MAPKKSNQTVEKKPAKKKAARLNAAAHKSAGITARKRKDMGANYSGAEYEKDSPFALPALFVVTWGGDCSSILDIIAVIGILFLMGSHAARTISVHYATKLKHISVLISFVVAAWFLACTIEQVYPLKLTLKCLGIWILTVLDPILFSQPDYDILMHTP